MSGTLVISRVAVVAPLYGGVSITSLHEPPSSSETCH
jgi:hypothetical protein